MFFGISDILFHPDAFFARISQEKVKLIPPLAIVATGSLLFAIVNIIFWMFPTQSGYSMPVLSGFFADIMLSRIITSMVLPFCVWAVFTVFFFLLARVAGGSGSLPETARDTGYGMLPWTLSVLLPFLSIFHRFLTYSGGPVIGGYCGIWLMPPQYCTAPLLLILLWCWFLWMTAIRYTHGFTLQRSALVTGIPVAAGLIIAILCMDIL